MVTTIQISGTLQKELAKKKMYERESYEDIIWNMMEDTQEISQQTKEELEKARTEIKAGKTHTFSEVKKRLGL